MKKSTIIRRGRHCVFNLHVHLVFVAKYRRKVFTKKSLQDLREIFDDICHKMGVELIEFEGERDHVHLLIHYLPTHSISKIVNALKGASSRRIRKMGYKRINNLSFGFNPLIIRGDFSKILEIFTEGNGQRAIFEVKSSRRARKIPEYQGIKPEAQVNRALWGKSLWSPSYFAGSCGGASIEVIRTYIANQLSPA